MPTFLLLTLTVYNNVAYAGPDPAGLLWTEASLAWQSRNDVGIPADEGTRFSLTDLGTGPVLAGRLYGQLSLWQRHELRLMWAPFTLRQEGSYPFDINFMGDTYAANTSLESIYRFNSYRLTYRYAVVDRERTSLKVGFTGKIRDAEIGLSQGELDNARVNVGFVPLLHFAVDHQLTDEVGVLLDVDGLWSPFGRAEDAALMATFQVQPWLRGLVGYRTVEGGADGGGNVYSFAWLHYLTIGMQAGGW